MESNLETGLLCIVGIGRRLLVKISIAMMKYCVILDLSCQCFHISLHLHISFERIAVLSSCSLKKDHKVVKSLSTNFCLELSSRYDCVLYGRSKTFRE